MGDGQNMNGQAVRILVVSALLSVLAILAVVLRFMARTHKSHSYYLDDYLVVLGLVLFMLAPKQNPMAA